METRKCKTCGEVKPLTTDFFPFRKDNNTFRWQCYLCHNERVKNRNEELKVKNPKLYEERKSRQQEKIKEWAKNNPEKRKEIVEKFRASDKYLEWRTEYNEANRDKITAQKREYRSRDPEYWKEYQASYYEDNIERIKIRDQNRAEEIRKVKREYMRKKRQSPEMKIHASVSRQIHAMITSQKSSKSGRTFQQYVNWSLDQLKQHLESLFEPWMTWDNYGKYNASAWNDQDHTTWTWQIDHIIPQSNLPYSSMEDENFKRCWELENLRPLSSKQNILDGVKRVRHY